MSPGNLSSTAQRKLKILLVRPIQCEPTDTETRLVAAGHCVTLAVGGHDAARTLRNRPVNLVLVECHNAAVVLDVLAVMRGHGGRLSTRYTPTYILTIASPPESPLPANVEGVLTSPIDCDALVTAYLRFLSESLKAIERTNEARGSCEIDAAIDRLGGDVELYKDLVARFLDDTAGTRRQLETARERRDPPLLHRAAHSLKGLAASVGAVAVAEVLGELEALARAEDLGSVPSVWQRFQSEMATAADELSRYHNADAAQPHMA